MKKQKPNKYEVLLVDKQEIREELQKWLKEEMKKSAKQRLMEYRLRLRLHRQYPI